MSLRLPPIFTTLQIPLLYTNNILGLALGPQHHFLRVSITLPVLILLASQGLYREEDSAYGMRYSVECLVLSLSFTYLDWVVLGSPDREEWRKLSYRKDVGKGGGKERGVEDRKVVVREDLNYEDAPRTFWERVRWGVRLAAGLRYVGWSQQVKNVPVEVGPEYSRWRFIIRKILRTLVMHLLADAFTSYTVSTPHGSWFEVVPLKQPVSLTDQPFLRRFELLWVHIILTYTSVEMLNAGYGVVSVATGLASPRECPSAFGDLRGMWGVRNAWSSVWHQQCRRICSAPGVFLARDVLNLRKGSFASKYLQLYVGFAVSGVVHAGPPILMSGALVNDHAFSFFMWQATLIMFEDHVIDLGKRMGFKDSMFWRVVGFVWAVFAIGTSAMRWTGTMVDSGMWVHQRSPDWFGIVPEIVADHRAKAT